MTSLIDSFASSYSTHSTTAKSSKSTSENVTTLAEYIVHIHTTSAKSTSANLECLMSKTVVLCTLFWIAQNLIGFGGFLKLFFCFAVIRIFIGLVLYCLSSISSFLIFLRCTLSHFYFVIISFLLKYFHFPLI